MLRRWLCSRGQRRYGSTALKHRLPPCSPLTGMTPEQKEVYERVLEDRGKT
eukprot:symbB.v1.2.036889.t1/scaffold5309.1/size28554/1